MSHSNGSDAPSRPARAPSLPPAPPRAESGLRPAVSTEASSENQGDDLEFSLSAFPALELEPDELTVPLESAGAEEEGAEERTARLPQAEDAVTLPLPDLSERALERTKERTLPPISGEDVDAWADGLDVMAHGGLPLSPLPPSTSHASTHSSSRPSGRLAPSPLPPSPLPPSPLPPPREPSDNSAVRSSEIPGTEFSRVPELHFLPLPRPVPQVTSSAPPYSAPAAHVASDSGMMAFPPPPRVPSAMKLPTTESFPSAPVIVMREPSSVPPPMPQGNTLPPAPLPPPRSRAPKTSLAPTTVPPPLEAAPSKRSTKVMWALGAVAAAAGVFFSVSTPRTGTLTVTVTGPGHSPVPGVHVQINGKEYCASSPCTVMGMAPGSAFVGATATGFLSTAQQATSVVAGEENVLNVQLIPEQQETGIAVGGTPLLTTLSIDGRQVGPLPQTLKGLPKGEHVLSFDGGDRYEPAHKKVDLSAGKVLEVTPPQLAVKHGRLVLHAHESTKGARVAVDGRLVDVPGAVDLDGAVEHEIIATRFGYETLTQTFRFHAGQADQDLTIELQPRQR